METSTALKSISTADKIIRFKNCQVLRNGVLQRDDLWVRNGRILDPMSVFYQESVQADVIMGCDGLIASPGFIDLQINGAFGIDFSSFKSQQDAIEGIDKVSKELLQYGVTSYCPTLVTSPTEYYNMVIDVMKRKKGGKHGAAVLGIHVEGPFINQTKKGAHSDKFIQSEVSLPMLEQCYGSLDRLKVITLAPELPGALETIPQLVDRGIIVSIGHSEAKLEQAEEAVNRGASLITHLFNAMLPFHHRDPGIVGLLTTLKCHNKQIYFSLISDGLHTHETVQRIAHSSNPQGTVLISDCIAALGLGEGIRSLGNITVEVKQSRTFVSGTNLLAGSIATMDQCVRVFHKATDCSIPSALEAASLHPARVLGEDSIGRLDVGCDADIVFLSEDLTVQATVIGGEVVWRRTDTILSPS